MPQASPSPTERVIVPHWFPYCGACNWLGPSFGTVAPSEPFVCGGCGRTGDAWSVRSLAAPAPAGGQVVGLEQRFEPRSTLRQRLVLWLIAQLPPYSLAGVLLPCAVVGAVNGVQLLVDAPFSSGLGAYRLLAGEDFWGTWMAVWSLVAFGALRDRSQLWQVRTAGMLALPYAYFATGAWLASPHGLVWGTYGSLALLLLAGVAAWTWPRVRAGGRARRR